MTSRTPTPKGLALALILTGAGIALAGSVAALATGHLALMGIVSIGFTMQCAGRVLNRRRNGGAP